MLKICCSLILVGRKKENQITLLRVLGCGEQNLVLSTERLHRLLWLINSLWSSTVLHHPNKEAESEEASACWQFQVLDKWKHRCCNPYLPCPGPELFPLYWSPLNGHELVRATVVFVWEISLASGSVWQQVDMLCRMQSHSFPMRDFSLLFFYWSYPSHDSFKMHYYHPLCSGFILKWVKSSEQTSLCSLRETVA